MSLSFEPLDLVCPMHAVICRAGRIVHAGPTFKKLRPDFAVTGLMFLDLFEVTRPKGIETPPDLWRIAGETLRVRLRGAPHTALKGVCVMHPGDAGLLINLSFGISIQDAVQDFTLSNADFAATDLAIEMLYLIEANAAAMEASQQLTRRLQGAKTAAEEQATTDTLTGLCNRRGLDLHLDKMVSRSRPFALLQVDLDFFKQVNDQLGHDAGDFVLREVSQMMRDQTRDRDLIARLGGDEFVLILDGAIGRDTLAGISDRMISTLSTPLIFDGQPCRISCSIGIVRSCDYEEPEIARLFKDADLALYASKRAGRSQFTFFREMEGCAPEDTVPFSE